MAYSPRMLPSDSPPSASLPYAIPWITGIDPYDLFSSLPPYDAAGPCDLYRKRIMIGLPIVKQSVRPIIAVTNWNF
jgi:hypothetical protein